MIASSVLSPAAVEDGVVVGFGITIPDSAGVAEGELAGVGATTVAVSVGFSGILF
jgi:hypothetical protein